METNKTEIAIASSASVDPMDDPNRKTAEKTHPLETEIQQPPFSTTTTTTLHGLRLAVVVAGLDLGVYLVALELTMLATMLPTLTDVFATLDDMSWYESSYVLALCVFLPLVGKMFDRVPVRAVYFAFMVVFEAGLLVCSEALSSRMFIAGRVVNGIGSAGLVGGAVLVVASVCRPQIRPVVMAVTMSMFSLGSMTGPIIAGVVTGSIGWRWSFRLLLFLGVVTTILTASVRIPEITPKPPLRDALRSLPRHLDPLGFLLFGATTSMLLLALTWGGSQYAWSSATFLGLVCGGFVCLALFCWSSHLQGDRSLVPPSIFRQHTRAVLFGSLFMFFQGGCTQVVPFYLPLWFQTIKGDDPRESAIHMLPSLGSMVVALITFGALVRPLRWIPPWGIVGSLLSSVGSGLLSTMTLSTSVPRWVGYQVMTHIGRGMAYQVPIFIIQEEVPPSTSTLSLATANLFMQLGISVSVTAAQTIFRNRLPQLLHIYVPNIDAQKVVDTGATDVRHLVPAADMPQFLLAYNKAITEMFYFSAATTCVAFFLGFFLSWKNLSVTEIGAERVLSPDDTERGDGLQPNAPGRPCTNAIANRN